LVLLGCAMAIVLFIVAVGVLYSGWFGHENPNALIVVQGDPSIADAFVSVRPLNSETRSALTAQFKSGIGNRLRFHVAPGRYEVDVKGQGLLFRAQEVDAFASPIIVDVSGRGATSRASGGGSKH
jgi:hypothetical protein